MKIISVPRLLSSACIIAGAAAVAVAAPEGPQPAPQSSRTIYDAFHSFAPNKTAVPLMQAPILVAPAIFPTEFRSVDGSGNNPTNLGTAGTTILRKTPNGYGDGISTPAGSTRKGTREISNLVNAQAQVFPNSDNISSYVWQWGQFTDHDLSIIKSANPAEIFNIPVPLGDPQFDPQSRGNKTLPFQRSNWTMVDGVRQQINANSAFLDASQIYGNDNARMKTMRANDGTGRLATSDGNLLPFNVKGLPNQPQSQPGKVINPADFFLAGDVRANETAGLTAMQTLFMREHNFWADSIKAANPTFTDDQVFFRARAIVNGETQLITYRDFLPIVLGPNALPPYLGYNSAVDPRVAIEFSTAGFRVGHTFLPPVLMRLNSKGRPTPGDIALGATFFEPQLTVNGGIETFLRGLAKQVPQQVDAYVIDAVRNFIFLGTQGFDLPSLNMQRGRDHGLGSYNQVRIGYGLAPKATFAEMTSNLDFQARLASAYNSPDDVDLWVGGLTEDHVNGGQVGETFFAIIKDQFERLRDGDRFWYESYLDADTLATVQQQTLGAIIKRNTTISREMQDEVFHVN
ncbi:MAG: peroxidase family protein [Spartobacteria bacterium]